MRACHTQREPDQQANCKSDFHKRCHAPYATEVRGIEFSATATMRVSSLQELSSKNIAVPMMSADAAGYRGNARSGSVHTLACSDAVQAKWLFIQKSFCHTRKPCGLWRICSSRELATH